MDARHSSEHKLDKATNRNVIFIAPVLGDGLGDIGHLVDMANPAVLAKHLPTKNQLGESIHYQPIYIVLCEDPSCTRIRFIIDALKSNQMITDEGHSFDLKQEDQWQAYLDFVLEKNPHFYLAGDIRGSGYPEPITKKSGTLAENRSLKEKIEQTDAAFFISCTDSSVCAFARLTRILRSSNQHIVCTQINEHGKVEGVVDAELFHYVHTMGFYSKESCGVFLKEPLCATLSEKAHLLTKLNDQQYLSCLLEEKHEDISLETAEVFLKENLFVPGYLQSFKANLVFVQSVAISGLAQQYQNVVFHLNQKDFNSLELDESLLAKQGFNKVEVYKGSSGGVKRLAILGGQGTRRLRIFTECFLNNEDYTRLYGIAQLIGGCSGDKTLELVLSNNLIPFYGQMSWKWCVSEAMQLLAIQQDLTKLVPYFDACSRVTSVNDLLPLTREMGQLINQDLAATWPHFNKVLRQECNIYTFLTEIFRHPLHVHALYKANRANDDDLRGFCENDDLRGFCEKMRGAAQNKIDLIDCSKADHQKHARQFLFLVKKAILDCDGKSSRALQEAIRLVEAILRNDKLNETEKFVGILKVICEDLQFALSKKQATIFYQWLERLNIYLERYFGLTETKNKDRKKLYFSGSTEFALLVEGMQCRIAELEKLSRKIIPNTFSLKAAGGDFKMGSSSGLFYVSSCAPTFVVKPGSSSMTFGFSKGSKG